ncbi:hypothetical protein COT64_01460 [Candidatus Shapirobacteria bacterium CG09_land_8_20_14_0_10_39_12]|uniref:DUF5667 domain-containing protein n=1 Tax=Candidatus Shapirobacteria bacterium CG09_land_8_20_14_0_10_39_12 TaxID=1974885 RepID=A0A2H0WRU9_9BACT|nr:MAG: hypothetical protein COT64_01460 [Candidatus Shapirobacteria bacterium CG09_land_8_20_14_0_10_39_12]
MLKKFIPVLAVLGFAAAILFISIFRMSASAKPSFAAASLKFNVSSPSVTPSFEPTQTPVPKSNYYLVYPGMLPDQPLYKLKMIRDKIWLALTSGSLKRSEVLLLFADKRVGAGDVLIKGNKVDLGLTTLTKGIKYFERAVTEINSAKQKGMQTEEMVSKLQNASLKYEEVLTDLQEQVGSESKTYLENLVKLIKDIQTNLLTS